MRSPCRLIQLLAIAACALPDLPVAKASIVRVMDLAELTAEADRIVVADVVSTQSAWDSRHRNIHTTIEISVQESWKGAVPGDGRIKIRQLGGTVGEIEMAVYGMARFEPGERALLFLRHSGVVGMSQGKWPVRWESTRKRWLVDARRKSSTAVASQPEQLERLRERVRALVRN